MPSLPTPDVLAEFSLDAAAPVALLDGGHIHQTWRVDGGAPVALQRINTAVFREVDALAANLERLEAVLVAAEVPTVRWRRTRGGAIVHQDDAGSWWRAYPWIPGDVSAAVTSRDDVEAISFAFGRYAAALADEPAGSMVETIPAFHDFTARERAWRFAVLRDDAHRFLRAQPEVERASRVLERVHELPEFESWGHVPMRIVHNDAKAANVVRDGERITIIDLDTTMPGPLLADVGELVRTMCRAASEDDDRAANALQTERFGLVLRGWLAGYGRELLPVEASLLPIAGIMLSLENALRFLADYLDGDIYFPVSAPDHNRARFRAQIGHAQVLLDGINDLRRVTTHELTRRA